MFSLSSKLDVLLEALFAFPNTRDPFPHELDSSSPDANGDPAVVCLSTDANGLTPVAKAAKPPVGGTADTAELNVEGAEANAAKPPEPCVAGITGFPNPVWPKLG